MINKKKILAIVPARGGSKGIKLKNLKKIKGKTLVEITSKFIDDCKFIDAKVLSTDHPAILKIGESLNFKNITRPKKLSGNKISDYQVITHALKNFVKGNFFPDYIIYLQPTSPVREKKHLFDTIKKTIKNKYDASWSVNKVSIKYHPLKLLKINKKRLQLIDKKGERIIARQMLEPTYVRNGVFYIFNTKKLLIKKTIYLKKILASITKYQVANIDDLDDLNHARKLMY